MAKFVVSEIPLYNPNSFFARVSSSSIYIKATAFVTAFFLMWLSIDIDYNASETLWDSNTVFILPQLVFVFVFVADVVVRFLALDKKSEALTCLSILNDIVLTFLLVLAAVVPGGVVRFLFGIGLQLLRFFRFLDWAEMQRALKHEKTVGETIFGAIFNTIMHIIYVLYVFGILIVRSSGGSQVGQQSFSTVAQCMGSAFNFGALSSLLDEVPGAALLFILFWLFVVVDSLLMIWFIRARLERDRYQHGVTDIAHHEQTSDDTKKSMDLEHEAELAEAKRQNDQNLVDLEQTHVAEALLRSKADKAMNQFIIWRLPNASAAIKERIQQAAEIAGLAERFPSKDVAFSAPWLNGALRLVPVSEEEVQEAGIHLQPYHIVSFRHDILVINEALATFPNRKGGRPVKEDWQTKFGQGAMASEASVAGGSSSAGTIVGEAGEGMKADEVFVDGQRFKVVVENTFFTVKSAEVDSVGGRASSAPSGWPI